MANETLDLKLRMKAIDRISSVMNSVKNKFPNLTKAVKTSSRAMRVFKMQTDGVSKSLSKTGKKLKGVGRGMTTGITAPLAAMGYAALNANANFQESFNKVEAKAKVSGKTFKELKDQALDLGSRTQFSASQAADAMQFLAQAGFDTGKIYSAVPAVLNLAASSGIELGRAADIASNVMGAFNMEASKTGHIVDVFAKATASSNIDMEMLAEAMKDAGPVAQKYGLSLEETTALIGKLGDAGIQGSKAGTTLKNMFLQLASPTTSIMKTLNALGVQAVDPATKKLRSMTDILVDLNKGFAAKNISQAKKLAVLNQIFGKRAIAGAGVLLDAVEKIDPETGKAVNTVAKFTKELENATGTGERMAKTMRKGLPGAIDRLKSSFEGLLLSIGIKGGLNGAVENLLDKFSSLFSWLSKLNPTFLKWTLILGTVVAAMGPLLLAFGTFLAFLPSMITGFGYLRAGWIAVKVATVGANVALLPYIAAIGALSVAAIMVYKNWKPIKAFFADFFTNPLEQVQDLLKWMANLATFGDIFGTDEVDKKLKEQGFKITEGGAKGAPIGSKEMTKKTTDQKLRTQKAQVDINFSNLPKDTRVIADDKENILGALSGAMGGL